jgi:polyphosphate kinase 2 (PPK2 family)
MLHISADEQKSRLGSGWSARQALEVQPRRRRRAPPWDEYMAAYQTVFERTSTPEAPWFVVPANRKWYARLAVQALLLDALEDIDPHWPAADFDVAAEKKRLADS